MQRGDASQRHGVSRVSDGLESECPPNVYLLQLRNRTWSSMDFCYLETAVRQNPNFQFHLIRLLNGGSGEKESRSEGGRPEESLREGLVQAYEHVRATEASIGAFFAGSKLAGIADSLDDGTLETAAKAQLLWTAPGIALDPSMHCSLKSVERFLSSTYAGGGRGNRVGSSLATIEPTRNIQTTGVACQAFLGFLIDEIWRNGVNRSLTFAQAADKYCSRRDYCPGVRMFSFKSKCSPDAVDCPIVDRHRAAPRSSRE